MKGNILLGQARGKLGDIVFSRSAGQQVARSRAQQVKNPRTEKQMIQRIILNTVAQAYSAMQPICDHSFEGVATGQKSMSYFMRKNMDALRAKIAQELNEGYDFSSIFAFSPVGSNQLVPNVYQIAKGTLPEVIALISGQTKGLVAIGGNTYADVINHYGLNRGDQLTFVALQGSTAANLKFHFARVILDPRNEDGSEAALSSALIADGKINLPSPRNEGEFNSLAFESGDIAYNFSAQNLVAVAVIVSRQNADGTWKRSNSSLTISDAAVAAVYPSLQDCLNLIINGGIDTLSDYYLNNSGTGALASAPVTPAAKITAASLGTIAISAGSAEILGSEVGGKTLTVNVANATESTKVFIADGVAPVSEGASVTEIAVADGKATTNYPYTGEAMTGYITIGIAKDGKADSVWSVVTLTGSSDDTPHSGDGD